MCCAQVGQKPEAINKQILEQICAHRAFQDGGHPPAKSRRLDGKSEPIASIQVTLLRLVLTQCFYGYKGVHVSLKKAYV